VETYLSLIQFGADFMDRVEERLGDLRNLRDTLADHDVTLRNFYLTMGRYDAVAVLRAQSGEDVAGAILSLAGDWDVETETLTAFDEDAIEGILEELT